MGLGAESNFPHSPSPTPAEQNLETAREQKREPILVTEIITQLSSE
jgi:hypothetical protein